MGRRLRTKSQQSRASCTPFPIPQTIATSTAFESAKVTDPKAVTYTEALRVVRSVSRDRGAGLLSIGADVIPSTRTAVQGDRGRQGGKRRTWWLPLRRRDSIRVDGLTGSEWIWAPLLREIAKTINLRWT